MIIWPVYYVWQFWQSFHPCLETRRTLSRISNAYRTTTLDRIRQIASYLLENSSRQELHKRCLHHGRFTDWYDSQSVIKTALKQSHNSRPKDDTHFVAFTPSASNSQAYSCTMLVQPIQYRTPTMSLARSSEDETTDVDPYANFSTDLEKFEWDQARWSRIQNTRKHNKVKKQRKFEGEEQVLSFDDDSEEEKYTIGFRQVWWLKTHILDSQKARHLQIYKYKIGSLQLGSQDCGQG